MDKLKTHCLHQGILQEVPPQATQSKLSITEGCYVRSEMVSTSLCLGNLAVHVFGAENGIELGVVKAEVHEPLSF